MTTASNAADNQVTRNLRLDLWIFRNGVRQTPDMSRLEREEMGAEEAEMARTEKYLKKGCREAGQRKKAGVRRSAVGEGWLVRLFKRRVVTADEAKLKRGLPHCPFSAALPPPTTERRRSRGPRQTLFFIRALFLHGSGHFQDSCS